MVLFDTPHGTVRAFVSVVNWYLFRSFMPARSRLDAELTVSAHWLIFGHRAGAHSEQSPDLTRARNGPAAQAVCSRLDRGWPPCCSWREHEDSILNRALYISCLLIALRRIPPRRRAISVTAPANGANAVAAANDFATTVLQDPWDMSQRTDSAGGSNSVDFPYAGAGRALSFSNGLFAGTVQRESQPLAARDGICRRRAGRKVRPQLSHRRQPSIESSPSGMCVPTTSYMMFGWTTNTIFDPPGLQTSQQRLHDCRLAYLHRRSGDARTARRIRTLDWHEALADARSRPRTTSRQAASSRSIGCAWSRTSRRSSATSRGAAPARSTSTSTTTTRHERSESDAGARRVERQRHQLFAQRRRPGAG